MEKIEVENKIFARAYYLRETIYARCGRLFCCTTDAYLQQLIILYNAFWGEENWSNFCQDEDSLEGYQVFKSQRLFCTGGAMVLRANNYQFEILC